MNSRRWVQSVVEWHDKYSRVEKYMYKKSSSPFCLEYKCAFWGRRITRMCRHETISSREQFWKKQHQSWKTSNNFNKTGRRVTYLSDIVVLSTARTGQHKKEVKMLKRWRKQGKNVGRFSDILPFFRVKVTRWFAEENVEAISLEI